MMATTEKYQFKLTNESNSTSKTNSKTSWDDWSNSGSEKSKSVANSNVSDSNSSQANSSQTNSSQANSIADWNGGGNGEDGEEGKESLDKKKSEIKILQLP